MRVWWQPGDKNSLRFSCCVVSLQVQCFLIPQHFLLLCAPTLGSPLVVSLIGALLREKPNRWRYYLSQLRQKQFKRIRKSSSYDYDALDQAMAASIEVLPEEHRELYKDLSVIEKDVKIPAKVELHPLQSSCVCLQLRPLMCLLDRM